MTIMLRRLLPGFFQPVYAQTRYLSVILLAWAVFFLLTRLILMAEVATSQGVELDAALFVLLVGSFYDVVFLLYAALVIWFLLLLLPWRWLPRLSFRWGLHLGWVISFFLMGFVAVAEYLFWDEFGVRFNFIAVDYLIYSKEVVDNVRQSYPLGGIFTGLGLLALLLGWLLTPGLRWVQAAPSAALAWRAWVALALLLSSVMLVFAVGQDGPGRREENTYHRELASNGPYQFFAAFRNNEIDYPQFYAVIPEDEVAVRLRQEVGAEMTDFVASEGLDIRRKIDNPGPAKRLNVILVTIESLSAKYLGSFGDTRGLTPNLDRLRTDSLFFSHFYATGTRTDRGLEAITLSIPPTPGRSIVKRIGRESGYASLGYQFQRQGYDTAFVYGGRGYFDNMNAFFSGNGYRIIDQNSVAPDEIHFENAWGMSDEDLYAQAIKQADLDHASGKPFFLQLMTTSNHRPYTYPEGRIDIPSGSGREGAVKYTDYAVGEFLRQAKTKPWFDHTVFVFVADHNAGSAGKQDLPIENYRIPLFVYSPANIPAAEVSTVASQIDLAPTLLGLLQFDYTSSFFGRDLLSGLSLPGRAVIGNYQHLGLYDGEHLFILSPRQGVRDVTPEEGRTVRASLDEPGIRRAVAYYQGASTLFRQRKLGPVG